MNYSTDSMSAVCVSIIFIMKTFGNQSSYGYLVCNVGAESDWGSAFSESQGLFEMATPIILLLGCQRVRATFIVYGPGR